jgi:hypothetical protein
LGEDLRRIYGDEAGLNMTKIERRRGSRLTSFLIRLVGLLFFLALVSWGGFLWWQTSNPSSSDQILRANIETEKEVISGAKTCFKIVYENTGRVPLAALAVALNLPETFSLNEATPPATEENHWTLSPLNAASDSAINICGVFRSSVPGAEKLQAVFTYRPANFNSDFQDIAGQTVTVEKTILTVETAGPNQAVVGGEATYTVKIKNTDTAKTENLRLRALLPATFSIDSAEPPVSEVGSAFWDIAALEAGAEQTVTFTGSFTSSASGIIPLTMEVGFLDAEKDFVKQAEAKVETEVLDNDLSLDLIANGSSADQNADLGDHLRLSLSYTNKSRSTMTDLAFVLTIDPETKIAPFNYGGSNYGGGARSGNTITWKVPALAAGDSGTFDSTLIISDPIDPTTTADAVILQVMATVAKIGNTAATRAISTTPFTIKLNSDTKLLAEARYFDRDGAPLGSGPLPPTTGQTTTYRIFLTVTNSLHNLNNALVSTTLPSSVAWSNNLEADNGALTFDETTRQVTWTIDSLSQNTSAWFDISITPSATDVGSFFTLVNPTSLEVTDAFTGDQLRSSTDALTTALPYDELAAGKGVVE